MSAVEDYQPISKASKAATIIKPNRSVPAVKVPEQNDNHSDILGRQYDYSRLNHDRPQT